jgi:pimeloyl-ACP methyl ester carboxylesterase
MAGIEPPGVDRAFELLFRDGGAPEPTCPCLFVHADDDPVAPAFAVRRRIAEPLITPWGGHLGFGAVLGADVYSSPLVERLP